MKSYLKTFIYPFLVDAIVVYIHRIFNQPYADEEIKVRVTLRPEGSDVEYEAYEHTYPADLERQQTITVNLPDERTYTCTVYQDDEPEEPFIIDW